jgi:hypothetical protein
VACFKVLSSVCLEILRKITKNLTQDKRSPGLNSKWGSLGYKAEVVITHHDVRCTNAPYSSLFISPCAIGTRIQQVVSNSAPIWDSTANRNLAGFIIKNLTFNCVTLKTQTHIFARMYHSRFWPCTFKWSERASHPCTKWNYANLNMKSESGWAKNCDFKISELESERWTGKLLILIDSWKWDGIINIHWGFDLFWDQIVKITFKNLK